MAKKFLANGRVIKVAESNKKYLAHGRVVRDRSTGGAPAPAGPDILVNGGLVNTGLINTGLIN